MESRYDQKEYHMLPADERNFASLLVELKSQRSESDQRTRKKDTDADQSYARYLDSKKKCSVHLRICLMLVVERQPATSFIQDASSLPHALKKKRTRGKKK